MHGWAMNIQELIKANDNYLEVIHTGEFSQLTIMTLKPGEDTGKHRHRNIDQLIRVETGTGTLSLGPKRDQLLETHEMSAGWIAFIPEGAWHNFVNTGTEPLKLQTIHSPAIRWRQAVYATREEAIAADEEMNRRLTMGMAGADGFGP